MCCFMCAILGMQCQVCFVKCAVSVVMCQVCDVVSAMSSLQYQVCLPQVCNIKCAMACAQLCQVCDFRYIASSE